MDNEDRAQGEDLVIVYRAPDEVTANLVQGLLEGEGVPVMLQSGQVPWMDGVMKVDKGYWGDVVVPKEHADRAKQIIAAYEKSGGERA